ncbi:hypothetical protein AVEN_193423-1 [Araneus ventricosus]|uniref:Uncharacterized protein n=1 Tax=Araneus ventricosus TaxID=182803 RepID=A0A4Y2S2W3_ARAVE|nr:hypothetical protein AVEN_193423-1 [Araneus ventricosus]
MFAITVCFGQRKESIRQHFWFKCWEDFGVLRSESEEVYVVLVSSLHDDFLQRYSHFFPLSLPTKNSIEVLGCDGTTENTGASNGSISLFENALKHPVQAVLRIITNLIELPLRKVMVTLDGPTSGPTSFSGPVGKRLRSCQDLPVVEYNKRESIFPEINFKELSTNQEYLWDICQALVKGECPQDLASRILETSLMQGG